MTNLRKNTLLIASAITLCAILCLGVLLLAMPSQSASALDSFFLEDGDKWPEGTFTSLNYGIYWYDSTSPIPKKDGDPAANFDPNKPTFIFTHGMKQGEGYHSRDLLSLVNSTNDQFAQAGYVSYEDEAGYDPQFYLTLLSLGYNVGQFYWSQIAEEDITGDVKIWTSQTSMGERYATSNSKGERRANRYDGAPEQSVAVLYGEAIKAALGENYNQTLRIAGHSMGGQLSLAVSQYLVLQKQAGIITNPHLVPERVSLIDPYLSMTQFYDEDMTVDSTGEAIEVGSYTVELCAKAMDDITAYGIAVDVYCGNEFIYRLYGVDAAMDTEDQEKAAWVQNITDRLTQNATWTYLQVTGNLYGVYSHTMIIDYYFTTIYEDAAYDNWGTQLPGFKTSTADVLALRGKGFLQEAKSEELNPFFQHNSNFVRVANNYEPITTTIQDVTDLDATTAKLFLDGAEIAVGPVAEGKYSFDVDKIGNYIIRLYQNDTLVLAKGYIVSDLGKVSPAAFISGLAAKADSVKVLDKEGNVVQTVAVEEGTYTIFLAQAGDYRVESYSGDKRVSAQAFQVDENMAVNDLGAVGALKAGQIFLIAIVAVVVVGLVVVAIIFAAKGKKKKSKPSKPDYSRE